MSEFLVPDNTLTYRTYIIRGTFQMRFHEDFEMGRLSGIMGVDPMSSLGFL